MIDTSTRYHQAKLALRNQVLSKVRPSRVLDLFSGRGEMWRGAWHRADHYLGVDVRPWRSDEPHHRLVMSNAKAVAALNLQAYNIFDLDAYGEPWSIAVAIAKRRTWAPGELGALVLTDGSSFKLRFASDAPWLSELIPRHPDLGIRDVTADVHRQAIAAWCSVSGVSPTWWSWSGGLTGSGSSKMLYSATVFCGITGHGPRGEKVQ